MKTSLLAAALLAACTLLPACKLLPQRGLEQTSGNISDTAPLTAMAVYVNPELRNDTPPPTGDKAPDPAKMQSFAKQFARVFADGFPYRLAEYGVSPRDAGHGVPLLRMSLTGYRLRCPDQGDSCQTQVRVEGSVLDAGGNRIWWFSHWIVMEEMDDAGYLIFANGMLLEMVRDHVIPRGGN